MIPLVRTITLSMWRLYGPTLEYDDLFSWGLLGLWEACKRFDGDRGVVFKTFARHRIKGAIMDGIRQQLRHQEHFRVAEAREEEMEWEIGYPPQKRSKGNSEELCHFLLHDLSILSSQEREIVTKHYIHGWSLEDLGRHYSVTRSWICRMLKRAVSKLESDGSKRPKRFRQTLS